MASRHQQRHRAGTAAVRLLLMGVCVMCLTSLLVSGEVLRVNRTVYCADAKAAKRASGAPKITISVPPSDPTADAFLIAQCDDQSADQEVVVFDVEPGARLVLDHWAQHRGSVTVVPADGFENLENVHVWVTNQSSVESNLRNGHALALMAPSGNVSSVSLWVDGGSHLAHTYSLCDSDWFSGVGCFVGSIVAFGTGQVSDAHVVFRGNSSARMIGSGLIAGIASKAAGIVDSSVLVSGSTLMNPGVPTGIFTAAIASLRCGADGVRNASVAVDDSTVELNAPGSLAYATVAGVQTSSPRLQLESVSFRAESSNLKATLTGSGNTANVAVALGAGVAGAQSSLTATNVSFDVQRYSSLFTKVGEGPGSTAVSCGLAAGSTRHRTLERSTAVVTDASFRVSDSSVYAWVESKGSVAVSVGIGSASSTGNLEAHSTAELRTATIDVSNGTLTARCNRYGCVAAAAGVAAAGSTSLVAHITTVVESVSIAVRGGTLTATSGGTGTGSAAAAVASGASGLSCNVTSRVRELHVRLEGGVDARATSGTYGAAAAIGGVVVAATSVRETLGHTIDVRGSSFAAVDSRLHVEAASLGAAAVALGVGIGSRAREGGSVVVVESSMLSSDSSTVTAITGDEGSPSACVGVAVAFDNTFEGTSSARLLDVDVLLRHGTVAQSMSLSSAACGGVSIGSTATSTTSVVATAENVLLSAVDCNATAMGGLTGAAASTLGLAVSSRTSRFTRVVNADRVVILNDRAVLRVTGDQGPRDVVFAVMGIALFSLSATTLATANIGLVSIRANQGRVLVENTGRAVAAALGILAAKFGTRLPRVTVSACNTHISVVSSKIVPTSMPSIVVASQWITKVKALKSDAFVVNLDNVTTTITTQYVPGLDQVTSLVASSPQQPSTILIKDSTVVAPQCKCIFAAPLMPSSVGLAGSSFRCWSFGVFPAEGVLGSASNVSVGDDVHVEAPVNATIGDIDASFFGNATTSPRVHDFTPEFTGCSADPVAEVTLTTTYTTRATATAENSKTPSLSFPQQRHSQSLTQVKTGTIPTAPSTPPPTTTDAPRATTRTRTVSVLPGPEPADGSRSETLLLTDLPADAPTSSTRTLSLAPAVDVPRDVVERAVPETVREATAGTAAVAVVAVVAVVPGALQPGAAGAPARFAALGQLSLCEEVEDPPLTVLPAPTLLTGRNGILFARLAERAVAVAVICVVLAVAALLPLMRQAESKAGGVPWVRTAAQAAFVIPASYVGPAVTGVATQLVSFYMQRGTLQPIDAESGEELAAPTASNAAAAGLAAVGFITHLSLCAVFALRERRDDADESSKTATATPLARIAEDLRELLCGGLRQTDRRPLCGLVRARRTSSASRSSAVSASVLLRMVFIVEVGTAHVFELLAGFRGTPAVCLGRAAVAAFVALMFVGYVCFVQPFDSALEHAFQLGLGVVQLLAGLLLLWASVRASSAEQALAAGEWAATAGVLLVLVQAAVLAVVSLRDERAASHSRQPEAAADGLSSEMLLLSVPDRAPTEAAASPSGGRAVDAPAARDELSKKDQDQPDGRQRSRQPSGATNSARHSHDRDSARHPVPSSNPLAGQWRREAPAASSRRR